MQPSKPFPRVLTIAGSDSGGGAGIQADLKTFGALGAYGASVITAVTAQNTQGVQGVHVVPAAMIAAQCDSVLSDIRIDAVKIGMLPDVESIKAVAHALREYPVPFVVFDPVLVATSGDSLALEDVSTPYVTVLIVTRSGHQQDKGLQAFVKAYQSPEVRQFIDTQFKGAYTASW